VTLITTSSEPTTRPSKRMMSRWYEAMDSPALFGTGTWSFVGRAGVVAPGQIFVPSSPTVE
jgi:hypothetical protein